jgi:hypothetical protein
MPAFFVSAQGALSSPTQPWNIRGFFLPASLRLLGASFVVDSGFQPAMVRAHASACTLSVTLGNSRRSSIAADSSPCCSKAARIASASASETTNIPRG